MNRRDEIREFLVTRRAKVIPEDAGLPVYRGAYRRVPGLRREEVALLTGVSVDYYTRLERGDARGVSDEVLTNLARALRLDEAERRHLFDLIRTGDAAARPRRPVKPRVRPGVQRILDALTIPAIVRTDRFDILAANLLGRALFAPLYDEHAFPVSNARFIFLDPRAQELFGDWEGVAKDTVATLRLEAGRDPFDKDLTDLIGELSTRSEHFRAFWASHDVHLHRNGTKRFRHSVVGDLDLAYESMSIDSDTGLTVITYSPEPDSPSAERLALLASWAAKTTTAIG